MPAGRLETFREASVRHGKKKRKNCLHSLQRRQEIQRQRVHGVVREGVGRQITVKEMQRRQSVSSTSTESGRSLGNSTAAQQGSACRGTFLLHTHISTMVETPKNAELSSALKPLRLSLLRQQTDGTAQKTENREKNQSSFKELESDQKHVVGTGVGTSRLC